MNPGSNDIEFLHREHLKYLKEKGPYDMDCSCEIFSNEQVDMIKEYGHWFKALEEGVLEPFTETQRSFIEVMKGNADPVSLEEKTWFLYKKRKEYEKKYSDRLKRKYSLDEDEFYNRTDFGKVRGAMMGTVNSTHSQGMQTTTFSRYKKK